MTGSTQSTLSIVSVTLQDQGVYQCSATNVDGLSSLSVGTTLLIVAAGVDVTQELLTTVHAGNVHTGDLYHFT